MCAFSSREFTFLEFGRSLVAAMDGNAIGGSVFVALVKFSHAHGAGRNPDCTTLVLA